MSEQPTRVTVDQLQECLEQLPDGERVLQRCLRQAAHDAQTIEGLRVWLSERQKWVNLPGDTIGHYGLAASDTLRELERLEAI